MPESLIDIKKWFFKPNSRIPAFSPAKLLAVVVFARWKPFVLPAYLAAYLMVGYEVSWRDLPYVMVISGISHWRYKLSPWHVLLSVVIQWATVINLRRGVAPFLPLLRRGNLSQYVRQLAWWEITPSHMISRALQGNLREFLVEHSVRKGHAAQFNRYLLREVHTENLVFGEDNGGVLSFYAFDKAVVASGSSLRFRTKEEMNGVPKCGKPRDKMFIYDLRRVRHKCPSLYIIGYLNSKENTL
jgi:hypothetical protein